MLFSKLRLKGTTNIYVIQYIYTEMYYKNKCYSVNIYWKVLQIQMLFSKCILKGTTNKFYSVNKYIFWKVLQTQMLFSKYILIGNKTQFWRQQQFK